MEMCLQPLSPSCVQPGLGSVVPSWTMSLVQSQTLGKSSSAAEQACSLSSASESAAVQCVQCFDACVGWWVSRREGYPHLGILRCCLFPTEKNSDLPCSAHAHICRGGSGEWHFPHWQGVAASVPTTVIYSLWVWARRDLKRPGLLKNTPCMSNNFFYYCFFLLLLLLLFRWSHLHSFERESFPWNIKKTKI